MGCACVQPRQQVKIIAASIIKLTQTERYDCSVTKDYFYSISQSDWALIIDMLVYKDLYEVGKLNKYNTS